MSFRISTISALEILDSRARPTIEVEVLLADGTRASAGVPSGASTGSGEAVELRDGDAGRYAGQGARRAAANVRGPIADALCGREFANLAEVDEAMRATDGTANKSRLGANAIVGVSMAVARALAQRAQVPLWRSLVPVGVTARLPVPHFNVVNGGRHASNGLAFQEFMLAPLGAPSLPDAVRAGVEVYGRLRSLLQSRGLDVGLGDEGGFAPQLTRPEDVLALLVEAIDGAGYETGPQGVAIALDPAASEFASGEEYPVGDETLTSTELVAYYADLVARFPIWSIEDGMAEDDDAGWRAMTDALGGRIQLVGDDNFVTDPARIAAAARDGIANAALIKVNQIGTVSETLQALAVCRENDYAAMVSHRSGETTDTFIADLAVGSGCGQLKSGAPARGERVAKYNRLLRIAADAPELPFGLPE